MNEFLSWQMMSSLYCSESKSPSHFKAGKLGCLGGSVIENLPSAQGVILGAGIESHIRLPARRLLLPLPVSLPISVSFMNK